MKKRILTTWCFFCGLVLAQNLEFNHYLQASNNPEYPYSIYVQNPNKQPLEISLKHDLSKLAPLTPGLGRETLASVHFAPEVKPTLILPTQTPQLRKDIPLNFRLETDAPIGVYNLNLEFPDWKPDMQPIALNTSLKFSVFPRLGNQYLYVGEASTQYLQEKRTLSPDQLNGSIFTLTAFDEQKATFAVEGVKGDVTLEIKPGQHFPSLALIIPDPTIAVLSPKFVGKKVWRFGGFKLTCFPMPDVQVAYQGSLDSYARIKRILRVAFSTQLHLAGGFGGGDFSSGSANFVVSTPIAIQFDQAFGLTKNTVFSQGNASETPNLFQNANCDTFTELDADPWQLERLLSLTPASPRVSRKVESLIGLDRWQVAWLWGFPSVDFGTHAELMKLSEWRYTNGPFYIHVIFEKDRVLKAEVPRMP